MTRKLSTEHIQRLSEDKTVDGRAAAAAGVAAEVSSGELSDAEREIALDIISILAKDAAEQVRAAMVDHLRHCDFLPEDTASLIANDIESIAIPFIEVSQVLSDADLLALIETGERPRQLAVARRPSVSPEISSTLIRDGH